MKAVLVVFLLSGLCFGEILRLSEVGTEGEPGVERMVLERRDGEEEEVWFVKQEVIVTEKDVEIARPDAAMEGVLNVRLTEGGGEKMIAATSKMVPGKSRIAVIIDGKIVSAPVLQSVPLGKNFVIQGLEDFDAADALARKISGREPDPEDEEEDQVPAWPELERRPYTDEEYAELKAEREKQGVFYLDALPTEEELDKALRKGMTRKEVEKRFGPPTMVMGDHAEGEADFVLVYKLAGEKFLENPQRQRREVGFEVVFGQGRVVEWSHTSGIPSPDLKMVGLPEPTLELDFPKDVVPTDGAEILRLVESIRIAPLRKPLNRADYGVLFTTVGLLRMAAVPGDQEESLVDLDCDLLKLLASELPEMENLKKEAVEGKVKVLRVPEVLSPYMFGLILPPKYEASLRKEEAGGLVPGEEER